MIIVTDQERQVTIALTIAVVKVAEEMATEEGLGVAINGVLSAYANLITRNGLQGDGARALRQLANLLEQEGSALLTTTTLGCA